MAELIVERKDRVGILELNRPERLNALTMSVLQELGEAIEAHAADEEVRVILMRGAGRAFCAGYDLDWGESSRPSSREADGTRYAT